MPHSTSPLAPGLFVAGTDTNVGKTLVSSGLLRAAGRANFALLPFKPAETGCRDLARPHDALLLQRAAGHPALSLDLVCPHRFRPPVAPAAVASPRLRVNDLVRAARRVRRQGAGILVESAGGLLSPYAPDLTGADLAAALGLPVLLIARDDLGTINHTLLALRQIERQRLPLAGLVLTRTRPGRTAEAQRNAELITALGGVSPLARLPYLRSPSPDAVADALARAGVTWPALSIRLAAKRPRRG